MPPACSTRCRQLCRERVGCYGARSNIHLALSGVILIAHESLYPLVRRLTARYTALWFNASGNLPAFPRSYSRQEKRAREKQLDALGRKESLDRKRIMAFVAREIPGRGGASVRRFLNDCGRSGERFAAQARRFRPDISDADLHQALRNLWVFNSIQLYLGTPVSLTPSSFAYSLLYPFTDNCLDGQKETTRGKQALLRWLFLQLSGELQAASDPRQSAIAELLGMIRREYPRSRRPDVHQSLLAIHRAQKKAMCLCGTGSGRTEHALVPLTIEKGGTSVLADGLLAGRPSAAQVEVIFGYGVLLQLVDDLEDLQEDIDGGHSSPFSRAIRHGTLEGITNRLFNLTNLIAGQLKAPACPQNGRIAALVENGCTLLIQEAVARHSHLYRRAYVALLDKYAPVGMAYLRKLRSN